MKIGIYGGSFNPIHNGHMHLAECVMNDLGLDKIIFVPSKISPHKSSDEYVSEKDRLKMIELAIAEKDKFELSDYELSQERVSYSVYTVRHFRELYPDDELFLLIGTDMLLCFEKWYCFEEIMQNVILAVAARNDGDLKDIEKKAEELSGYGKIIVSKSPAYPVSSTEIRKKIRKNQNWSCYLDENVVQYIRLGTLYM